MEKSVRWKEEYEFRFVRENINEIGSRIATYDPSIVKEIVFAMNTSVETAKEVFAITIKKIPNVKFFEVKPNKSGYGLIKQAL